MTEMDRPIKVLVSTFGSGGDLFPLVPVLNQLAERGADTRVAAGRALGLYLRSAGIAAISLGDGSELRALDDPRLLTTRFDGWSSWRRVVTHYAAPMLRSDVTALESVLDDWRPDVVVASGSATAARLVAHRHRIPLVNVSLSPERADLASSSSGFARPFTNIVRELCGDPSPSDELMASLAWGEPSEVLFHDRGLLGERYPGADPIGFPYWDDVPARAEDERALDTFIDGGPTIIATLGSFIGAARQEEWVRIADAAASIGVRAAFVGVRNKWADETFAGRNDIVGVGFVPLARHLPRAVAAVHHGGIGTTFAALTTRTPAVVLPQAFDQTFNARLVQDAGVGVDASGIRMENTLQRVLEPSPALAVASLAERLEPADRVVGRTVSTILAAAAVPVA